MAWIKMGNGISVNPDKITHIMWAKSPTIGLDRTGVVVHVEGGSHFRMILSEAGSEGRAFLKKAGFQRTPPRLGDRTENEKVK